MLDTLTLLTWLVKAGFYGTSLLTLGLCLHRVTGLTDTVQGNRLITGLAISTALLMAARLFMANAQLGGSLDTAFETSMFGWVWAAHQTMALTLWAGIGVILFSTFMGLRLGLLIGAFLLAVAYSFTGHTQALAPGGLDAVFAPYATSLHVLIAGFWIAAPISLYPAETLTNTALHARTEAFSKQAMLLVPILFISGLWLAVVIGGGFTALYSTAYGQFLSAKLLLACAALSLGAANKFLVTRKLAEAPDIGRQYLKNTLKGEALFFALILSVIAWVTVVAGPEN